MSEFKSGDEVLDGHNNECEVCTFIAGPDAGGDSCLKNAGGHFIFSPHKRIKPKPKTITVEMPKPEHIVRRHTSIEVYLKSVSDAEKAYSSLTAIIYPKGVE